MNKISPEQFGARVVKDPTPEQIAATQALQAQVISNRAKFLPLVGKSYVPKEERPRVEVFKIIEYVAALPMSQGRGVRPAFRLERSPIPGVHFADAEEFLATHNEIVETADAPAAAESPAAE